MTKLLSGNEALALGAYHAGVTVAAAYPGTPSTEILENLARFDDIYAEWSTNEKVAMEVGLGAAYAGVRSLVSMKHVGLNVASDPFMAAATTGVDGGMVVISADDPGMHSSQNEQDNRHYARLAKVPLLEPSDSQEAYEIMAHAFNISEEFDTPVLVRTTTRVSHSKSVVKTIGSRRVPPEQPGFCYDQAKYVMLPAYARLRHPIMEERLVKLASYAETFLLNRIITGERWLGIISSGIAYQYAGEVFPQASFLKLTMTYPLPRKLIKKFAEQVERLIVIEELDPFLEDSIRAMGIKIMGKELFPVTGELNPDIIEQAAAEAGLLKTGSKQKTSYAAPKLPGRPPLLCPGCPHSGIFFVLSSLGQRSSLPGKPAREPKLIITGDIGCYTLGAHPPLSAMDTCACMGAGIGQALGMEKAGVADKIVAVIGDSTFLHSGITGLVNSVYNKGKITIVILDNRTTAMTGHQEHPGTGITAQGQETTAIDLEQLAQGIGISDVKVVDAFDIKALRAGVKSSLDSPELSVIIVRGACAMLIPKRSNPRSIDGDLCNMCGLCLLIGCPSIRREDERVYIDASTCVGDACDICRQVCPKKAIVVADNKGEKSDG
jgi:indolepyruvate ferredoxin oxidoreductase alpha subunit